jgi:hypothetical protein
VGEGVRKVDSTGFEGIFREAVAQEDGYPLYRSREQSRMIAKECGGLE